jgi:NADPH:quinone reductase-like Zn-dependent oxidoreductase
MARCLREAVDDIAERKPMLSSSHVESWTSMKAILYTRYGPPDVLQLREVGIPAPADNEVLIKVCAASVNPLDLGAIRGFGRLTGTGLLKPRQGALGSDFAGRVEAVGGQVKQYQVGDEVFGGNIFGGGAFAEYVCAAEDRLARKPANISFEQAAAVPVAAVTALQGLRDKGQIQPGQKVLIDGASGGVGTFAIQIAKSFGTEVTAVCSSRNVDTARSIGADHVIDYTREDFTRSGQRYDLILAANAHHSMGDYTRALSQNGIYVWSGGGVSFPVMLLGPLVSLVGRKKIRYFLAKLNKKDLTFLADLLEAGKVIPVIDRHYPLSDTADAVRYLAEGHARGKVVITIQ